MKNFDGIIFDVDGTLAATHDLIFESFNYVAEKFLNKRFTNDEIVALFGPTEDVILKDWMDDNYESARRAYYEFYESRHDEMAPVFPGLIEIIELIKRKNIPLGIFTGKGRDSSIITLKAIDVYHHFDLMITGDDVAEHKPSPEGINKFVNKFDLIPKRVLMVGDAAVDVAAAKKSGAVSALVLWDVHSRERFAHVQADYVFKTVDEFQKFINKNI